MNENYTSLVDLKFGLCSLESRMQIQIGIHFSSNLSIHCYNIYKLYALVGPTLNSNTKCISIFPFFERDGKVRLNLNSNLLQLKLN